MTRIIKLHVKDLIHAARQRVMQDFPAPHGHYTFCQEFVFYVDHIRVAAPEEAITCLVCLGAVRSS